ncbi:hypothetical protein Pan216_13300 [Planctomycetes bacterium Pan216]|uniref:Uncharacterized protein n=1 Tax=Kolteria novifilia TaxID=2527975 RepID=A0A518B0H8_9BACT|nr:hypothetical protein Pan216_13300 [Planctomycetes bacterium Pan216]
MDPITTKPLVDPSLIELLNAHDMLEFLGLGIAMILGSIIVICCFVVSNWRSDRRHQRDVALKQELLDRGLSADEIVRIVEANSEPPAKCG